MGASISTVLTHYVFDDFTATSLEKDGMLEAVHELTHMSDNTLPLPDYGCCEEPEFAGSEGYTDENSCTNPERSETTGETSQQPPNDGEANQDSARGATGPRDVERLPSPVPTEFIENPWEQDQSHILDAALANGSKIRDFAYEATSAQQKAPMIWDPRDTLQTYDWCHARDWDLRFFFSDGTLLRMVEIGWLTREEIARWEGARRVLEEEEARGGEGRYPMVARRVQRPSREEREGVVTKADIFSTPAFEKAASAARAAAEMKERIERSEALEVEQAPRGRKKREESLSPAPSKRRRTQSARLLMYPSSPLRGMEPDDLGEAGASAAMSRGTRRRRDGSPSPQSTKRRRLNSDSVQIASSPTASPEGRSNEPSTPTYESAPTPINTPPPSPSAQVGERATAKALRRHETFVLY